MKKGASHFEMAVSFVLFITFVFFVLYYLRPPQDSFIVDSALNNLPLSFENVVKTNLTKIFLDTNSSGCFSVNINSTNFGDKSFVLGVDDKDYNSHFAPESASVPGVLNIDSKRETFYIYFSREFSNSDSVSCPLLPIENYTFGVYERSQPLSYSALMNLVNEYKNEYPLLKSKLKLASALDFGITSDINDFILNKEIPQDSKVVSKAYIYPVVYSDGKVENHEVNFKIWR